MFIHGLYRIVGLRVPSIGPSQQLERDAFLRARCPDIGPKEVPSEARAVQKRPFITVQPLRLKARTAVNSESDDSLHQLHIPAV